ncbi:hypothetical protein G4V39_00090 [Thermosulfuriphilus ammonigenes]|uniref:Uncharacterized protein n=1 Tax=Thermosulfuriphilus ammonigenes TaxID=1936021 RepID=A0A6G7PSY8_9BACT|nr:putative metalloprotease CJM1_0395 family protein [Thermosulfuriphilus ammonigenes]MBA2849144.1 hypothetical protein [Thermosulfuriphilus ammonigenes]QIJ70762.1 hypothetical protein G4V39_00090 [Thermosulfuriphilus ammonigenes]
MELRKIDPASIRVFSSPSEQSPREATFQRVKESSSEAPKSSDHLSLSRVKGKDGQPLSPEELAEIRRLKQIDAQVRAHEMAHLTVGGQYVRGGPHYQYRTGPDGRKYAVGGEVSIDTSSIPGDPRATLAKMRQVKRAALAPANPSPQDYRVAAKASQKEREALEEILKELIEKRQMADQGKYTTSSVSAPVPGELISFFI